MIDVPKNYQKQIRETTAPKILPAQAEPDPLLRLGGEHGGQEKTNLDMEYWLEYFHLHIDLNLLRDKVFCRRPFLLHL